MFIFKDKSSDQMGVYAKEENFLGKAPVSYDTIEIEGKDGQELIPVNYNNFSSSLVDVVIMKNNIDEVMSWLSGKGELEYLGKVTTVHFLESYQVKKHHKPFSIPFVRAPFWYKADDYYVSVSDIVENEGNAPSKPLIKLVRNGTDNVEVKIGGVQFEYDFKGEKEVIIDCEDKNASFGGLFRNKQLEIGFEFPTLLPGENEISKLKGNPIIEVKRKDVWL